ncbi:bifunctional glyoxylate/hydroxypyruvate reductase B [Pseudomonas fluorescens NCIMB 11764]|uniref:Bifunctional glyoxylate/hydroxypyruvate reductase B n=1 Tax=Pseudomonas fluorescens NCIMB 11764 TaxID=1221522 RepID=A0A0K1QUQ6_PSEFL|nr:D-glycerate dehydrogenase [Pseudomonas fluorescens]AKV09494.1 bifunctional glyoxylate/hydroxypyruvate reductase B [Pseudomonas fluorescens NCIMB 11764]
MKKTILAFSRVSPSMLEPYIDKYDIVIMSPKLGDMDVQFEAALPNAHGLIGGNRRLGEVELASAKNLEIISSISVGYDNYDLSYINSRGIMLTNTPDVLNETTADLAFALILATARRIPELDAWTKNGNWSTTIDTSYFGCDVHGKTLGIIGLGKIGEAIARRGFFGFGMNILYSGKSRKPQLEQELGARFVPQEQLLIESDFVCPVVPLTAETRNLIGQKELALIGAEGILINVSRGPVVDQDALIQALEEKTIRGAGLDVYVEEPLTDSRLFKLKNVVTVPHIGSATNDTRDAMAKRALDNLLMGLEGQWPRDLVNSHALRQSELTR